MIAQKSGSIVNISSLAADERDEGTVPTGVAYAVAKAAVDRFCYGLATEVGCHNIAVNNIKPKAPVDTDRNQRRCHRQYGGAGLAVHA
jgi:NAD(P)-dependent dehydrogenase (short-subunit alcohol dehydrogenase family)